jgi:hypothetical protein
VRAETFPGSVKFFISVSFCTHLAALGFISLPFFENETVEEGDKTFLPYFLSSLAACLHGRPGLRVCTGVNVGGANCT